MRVVWCSVVHAIILLPYTMVLKARLQFILLLYVAACSRVACDFTAWYPIHTYIHTYILTQYTHVMCMWGCGWA